MKDIFVNEKYAEQNGCNAQVSTYWTTEFNTRFVKVEDIIDTLQNEANEIAGTLMAGEKTPSPETETDRRYLIGKWDKINELINVLKANGTR